MQKLASQERIFRATERHDERDLALARRCAAGDLQAHALFEREYLVPALRALSRLRLDESVRLEVQGALRDRVLPPPSGLHNKIASYTGRGALLVWVKVAAVRVALNLQSKQGVFRAHPPTLAFGANPEEDARRLVVAPLLKEAIGASLSTLDVKARSIVRLYFFEGINADELGRMFGMHRVSIWRTIERVKSHVRTACLTQMQERLGATPSECESALRDAISCMGSSWGRLLDEPN
jgi:RNA polymerase sigma-70 factor, ECF subfamily